MFEFNSDNDNSEDDADYVPSLNKLDDDDEQPIGIPNSAIPNDIPKPTIPEKNYEEEVWKKFMSDAKSKCTETETNKNVGITIDNKFCNNTNQTQCDKPNQEEDSKSKKITSVLDQNLIYKEKSFKLPSETIVLYKKRVTVDTLVGKINKKPKTTILQKSIEDWNSFKRDEGLEESLKQYNKGRGGFVEKQAFLLRSDLASFDIEKNIRLNKK